MTRRGKAGIAVLALLLLLGVGYVVVRRLQAVQPTALVIGPETTRITRPLGPDGRVDFMGALNARPLPAPEENAAVPLLRVVGTGALIGDLEQIHALLGAPTDLPVEGSLEPKPEDLPFFDDMEDLESEEDRKAFCDWVGRNEEAFALLVAASQRRRLAWPFVRAPDGALLQSALPYETWSQIMTLLQARALLHLAAGEPRAAWSDAEVQLRLAVLLEEGPLLLWRAFALGARGDALAWVGRALAAGVLDEAACTDASHTLRALPAPAAVGRAVLENERLVLIDAYIQQVAEGIRKTGEDPAWHPANVALTAALREINARFDDMETRFRPTAAQSLGPVRVAVEELRAEVARLRDELKSASGMAEHALEALVSGGAHQGRLVGTVLAVATLTVLPMLFERSIDVEVHRELVLVALALRIHERRTGAFPATLRDLDPGLLPDLSKGPLDLAAVTYGRGEDECTLEYACDSDDITIEVAAGPR